MRSWNADLICDRDAKFGTASDAVLASIDIETVLTAPQAGTGNVKERDDQRAAQSRPFSADTLREQLRVGASRARQLTAAVRALDRAAVEINP
ncbi:hypothetical protein JOF56_011034 [Kibdelosporangium banguiense]|uniref:DUF222 domain-containing protein n=1 Tax=Kibdelosporangium banguiense TaxID=1365924 RepID=A0ABS4U1W9_9PSEU|nr:hypothetical protein [Kibdelosporangium banguiense]MBP2330649.1 hypothetical protein [Kibdelosporangium banguiense]